MIIQYSLFFVLHTISKRTLGMCFYVNHKTPLYNTPIVHQQPKMYAK